jgi:hypothetical protein
LATHSSSSACAAASDAKTRSVPNSVRIARWKRSILPVVVGERGRRVQVPDAGLPADPLEQHLDRRGVEPGQAGARR